MSRRYTTHQFGGGDAIHVTVHQGRSWWTFTRKSYGIKWVVKGTSNISVVERLVGFFEGYKTYEDGLLDYVRWNMGDIPYAIELAESITFRAVQMGHFKK